MSILLIDDEQHVREALKQLLSRMGWHTVVEARDLASGRSFLEKERARFRFVFCDDELIFSAPPEILEPLSDGSSASRISLVLLTSGLISAWPEERMRNELPRIDALLPRPVYLKQLRSTMGEAFRHQIQRHPVLLFFGTSSESLKALSEAALWLGREQGRAPEICSAQTYKELVALLAEKGTHLQHVLIEPASFPALGPAGLQLLRRLPLGRSFVLVTLGRRAQEIHPFRSHSQWFVEPPRTQEAWRDLLARLTRRAESAWEMDLWSTQFHFDMRQGQAEKAATVARRMIALEPEDAEAHLLLGDALSTAGNLPDAAAHYAHSIQTNPCFPGTYIKLMALWEKMGDRKSSQEKISLAEQARCYCPGHPGAVQMADRWKQAATA